MGFLVKDNYCNHSYIYSQLNLNPTLFNHVETHHDASLTIRYNSYFFNNVFFYKLLFAFPQWSCDVLISLSRCWFLQERGARVVA